MYVCGIQSQFSTCSIILALFYSCTLFMYLLLKTSLVINLEVNVITGPVVICWTQALGLPELQRESPQMSSAGHKVTAPGSVGQGQVITAKQCLKLIITWCIAAGLSYDLTIFHNVHYWFSRSIIGSPVFIFTPMIKRSFKFLTLC